MNKSSQYNHQQTEPQNQSSASLKLRNYVFSKTWKLAIAISEKINTRKLWGFHANREFLLEKLNCIYT